MSRVKPVDQATIKSMDNLFAPVVERMGFYPHVAAGDGPQIRCRRMTFKPSNT